MNHARRPSFRAPFLKCLPLGIAALLLASACTQPADNAVDQAIPAESSQVAANATNQPVALPVQDFIIAFHKASIAAGLGANTTYEFPAIWLYAPDGTLHSRITDEAGLEQLRQTFGSLDPASAQGDGLNLDAVAELVAQAGASLDRSGNPEAWTALVLLGEEACGQPPCPAFAETAARLQDAHPDTLHATTVTLVQ